MKVEGPRFHPKEVIPVAPEGMVVVKFHGQPALIPAREEGEPMFGRSSFTMRQVEALIQLEQKRQRNVRATRFYLGYPDYGV